MDEWCAVCAEPLEWVAYGPCGHREVCFTCTARLRFVLEDKRCCICKQDCPCVFVTKALGDYTKVITDFSALQEQQLNNEEKSQSDLWYESNVQAFFDDEEPFRIIEAMCRLYCSACEGIVAAGESLPKGGVKKGHIFKHLESLRSHLFATHKLIMCELCLKGRKVFICEQKLYTRTQLEQHLVKGDSKVDGTQEERAGFTGHPMCEFCRKRFYGENELYGHMSTEHYTCHLCQRARPGHFEYYRNYDDLEMHFGNDHELCEHPDCLAKKFVVFANQADLKHHNAMTHGGNMSRSQRNAALQIPVSFQYRRPGQDSRGDVGDQGPLYRRGGRDRGPSSSNGRVVADSLDAAVQGSVESALLEDAIRESAAISASIESAAVRSSGGGGAPEASNLLSNSDTHGGEGGIVVSRYASAVSGSGPSALANSAFPPLPGLSQPVRPDAKLRNQSPVSMAARLGGGGGRGGVQVLNMAASRPSTAKVDTISGVWAGSNNGSTDRGSMVQATSGQGKGKLQGVSGWASSNGGSTHQGTTVGGARSEEEEALQGVSAVSGSGPPPGTYRSAPGGGISSSGMGHVISPMQTADFDTDGAESVGELSMEEIRAANKALIKRIHAGLKGNEKQFADFKDVSDQFRKGAMSARDYDGHITRLGLSHIVPELARLCPDPVKRKELLEVHRTTLALNDAFPPVLSSTASSSQRGKDAVECGHSKVVEGEAAASLTASATQVQGQPTTEDVEVLPRDGYRSSKGKSKVEESSSSTRGTGKWVVEDGRSKQSLLPQVLVKANRSSLGSINNSLPGWTCAHCTLVNQKGSLECAACGSFGPATASSTKSGEGADSAGVDKRKQKASKFQRVRLGDGSVAAILDSTAPNGAWKNGGGQWLVSMVQTEPVTDAAWDRK